MLKTGTQAGANDLLNRTELDARYSQTTWVPRSTLGVGQIIAFAGGLNGSASFALPAGTWVYVWFAWSSNNNNEFVQTAGVGEGSGTINQQHHQAFAMRIA